MGRRCGAIRCGIFLSCERVRKEKDRMKVRCGSFLLCERVRKEGDRTTDRYGCFISCERVCKKGGRGEKGLISNKRI